MEILKQKRPTQAENDQVAEKPTGKRSVGKIRSREKSATSKEAKRKISLLKGKFELGSAVAFTAAPTAAKPKSAPSPPKSKQPSSVALHRLAAAMMNENHAEQDGIMNSIKEVLLELMEPLTPQQLTLVDQLANDLIIFDKAKGALDRFFKPSCFNGSLEVAYERHLSERRGVLLAEQLLAGQEKGVQGCSRSEVDELAPMLIARILQIQRYAQRLSGWNLQETERVEHDRLWRVIGPFEDQLADPQHVAKVMSAPFKASDEEHVAIRELLREFIKTMQITLNQTGEWIASANRLFQEHFVAMALSPKALDATDRYIRNIEKGLLRSLSSLRTS